MSEILQKLYNGEIFPADQYNKILEEKKIMRERQIENYDTFLKKLDSPLDEEFIKIMDEQLDTVPLDFFEMFSNGFKLGAKLMLEILHNDD